MDSGFTKLGHGSRAAKLKLALHADWCAASTSGSALVEAIARDTPVAT